MHSYRAGTLTVDAARDIVTATLRGTFANSSVRREIEQQLAIAADLATDLRVHDGDLVIDGDLRLGADHIGTLIVRGNLTVRGLFATSLDPNCVAVVTGDLHAQRLISDGFLEVQGSVVVEREALWLDNDGCAEILGDLRAGFLYTKYHAVNVHGRVDAPLVLGDDRRFTSPHPYAFVNETDDAHKTLLRDRLPADVLAIEGDPDDPDDWNIDYLKSDVLRRIVLAGKPVLR